MTTLNAVGAVSCRPHDAVTRLEIPTAVKAGLHDRRLRRPGEDRRRDRRRENFRPGRQEPRSFVAEHRRRQGHRVPLCEGRRPVCPRGRAVAPAGAVPRLRGGAADRGRFRETRRLAGRRPGAGPLRAVAPVAPPLAPAPPAEAPAAPVSGKPGFTGRRLSLDFKDADVNDILRLISEVSGLNFVAGTEVKGTVSIKLADVPWDQALDLILKTNNPQLAQIRESDNIVRITTADKIRDEEQRRRATEEDKKKTIDAQKALEPMFTKTFSISYIDAAKMGDFVAKLEKFMTPNAGTLQFDERTKSIIVVDTARNSRRSRRSSRRGTPRPRP